MKLPKYVQAWVDCDGRARCYFRRRGYPLVQLRSLPWSPSFMAAYEAALTGPRTAIGAGRIKPGSVAAVVAEYLDSQQFFGSKSAGTQRMRRGILDRFRKAHGDRPFALLPPGWIEALLDAKPPYAARSWLATLRSLCQFAVKRGWMRTDPTENIEQRSVKATVSIRGRMTRSRNSRRTTRSAPSRALRSRYCSTPRSGAAMSCAWGGSTSARQMTGQPCTSSSKRPALSFCSRFILNCKPSSTPRRRAI